MQILPSIVVTNTSTNVTFSTGFKRWSFNPFFIVIVEKKRFRRTEVEDDSKEEKF